MKVVAIRGGTSWAERPQVPELEFETPLFVDWMTIRQVHPSGLPKLADGWMLSINGDGTTEYQTEKRMPVVGSFESTVWVRCNGNQVEFHGNISRHGRRDNVFGYTVEESIRRVNELLNLYSLPPFTRGVLERYADTGAMWTGARFSRIDITKNHAAFSWNDAQQVIRILAGHHIGRQKGTVTPDGTTVLYGYGSKYASGKCYLKAHELEVHRKKKSGEHVGQDVVDFCRDVGVLREEFTLKSRFLTQMQLAFLGDVTHARLEAVYQQRSQLQRLDQMTYPDLGNLSAAVRGTLARYENGEALNLKRRTFYNHRRALLPFGVDISVVKPVQKFAAPVRVIERAQLVAPEWYRRKYG